MSKYQKLVPETAATGQQQQTGSKLTPIRPAPPPPTAAAGTSGSSSSASQQAALEKLARYGCWPPPSTAGQRTAPQRPVSQLSTLGPRPIQSDEELRKMFANFKPFEPTQSPSRSRRSSTSSSTSTSTSSSTSSSPTSSSTSSSTFYLGSEPEPDEGVEGDEDVMDALLRRMQREIARQRQADADADAIPIRRFYQPGQSGVSRGSEMLGRRLSRHAQDYTRQTQYQARKTHPENAIHSYYRRHPEDQWSRQEPKATRTGTARPRRHSISGLTPQEESRIRARQWPKSDYEQFAKDSIKAKRIMRTTRDSLGQKRDERKSKVSRDAPVIAATPMADKKGGLQGETIGEEAMEKPSIEERKKMWDRIRDFLRRK